MDIARASELRHEAGRAPGTSNESWSVLVDGPFLDGEGGYPARGSLLALQRGAERVLRVECVARARGSWGVRAKAVSDARWRPPAGARIEARRPRGARACGARTIVEVVLTEPRLVFWGSVVRISYVLFVRVSL